jgi:hypothetical protein
MSCRRQRGCWYGHPFRTRRNTLALWLGVRLTSSARKNSTASKSRQGRGQGSKMESNRHRKILCEALKWLIDHNLNLNDSSTNNHLSVQQKTPSTTSCTLLVTNLQYMQQELSALFMYAVNSHVQPSSLQSFGTAYCVDVISKQYRVSYIFRSTKKQVQLASVCSINPSPY